MWRIDFQLDCFVEIFDRERRIAHQIMEPASTERGGVAAVIDGVGVAFDGLGAIVGLLIGSAEELKRVSLLVAKGDGLLQRLNCLPPLLPCAL